MDKKLTLSLACSNPLRKYMKMENQTSDPAFQMKSKEWPVKRDITLTLSYQFGNLKNDIKKIIRGILNDDLLNGTKNNGKRKRFNEGLLV